jgi:malonyl-CoA/methylmalonyl-CoA synthetase
MIRPDQDPWQAHGFSGVTAELTAQGTLLHAMQRHWDEHPDRVVLINGPTGLPVTWAALRDSVNGAVGALHDYGIGPGKRVLMSCTPSVDLVVAHLAVLWTGAIVVPVNTGFTNAELTNIARVGEVSLCILSDPNRWDPSDVQVVAPTQLTNHSNLRAHHPLVPTEQDDPAMLLFTSGTTGTPKGALLTHGNLLASASALVHAWAWTPADRLVLCLPLFHMHGLGVGVHGTLLAGGSAVIQPGFDEDQVLDAIRDHDATLLFGVPTMWTRLLNHGRVQELSTLRLCVSGSAPLPATVWQGLVSSAGQHIVERYGMTETVMLTSNPLHGDRRPGTVGFALPGVSVQIHEPGPDGVGEIIVRGPNVFGGYLGNVDPSSTFVAIHANGDDADPGDHAEMNTSWFRTCDLGRFDPDGYLSIVGRSKDLIITGGYNVYPSDVEAVLREHPNVADAAVLGEPSELWGETVAACVILHDTSQDAGTTSEELVEFARSHLADYQRPRRIVLMTAFPRNALGKVVKADLRTSPEFKL